MGSKWPNIWTLTSSGRPVHISTVGGFLLTDGGTAMLKFSPSRGTSGVSATRIPTGRSPAGVEGPDEYSEMHETEFFFEYSPLTDGAGAKSGFASCGEDELREIRAKNLWQRLARGTLVRVTGGGGGGGGFTAWPSTKTIFEGENDFI